MLHMLRDGTLYLASLFTPLQGTNFVDSRQMEMRKWPSGTFMRFLLVVTLWIHAAPLVPAASKLCNESEANFPLWSDAQMEAIKNLTTSWSATPNPGVNLQNWNTTYTFQGDGWWSWVCDDVLVKGLECFTFEDSVPGYMYNCTGTATTRTYRISGLTLSNASITGPLPAAIGDLYPLSTLTLTGNPGLYGNIPPEISNLSDSLSTLDLHNNNLSGPIPRGILEYFPYLQNLDLSGNGFTGNVSNLTEVNSPTTRTFNLARNNFVGNTPLGGWFPDSQLLESMDLSYNKLSGHVPNFDHTNKQLFTYLNLAGNQFTAESLDTIGVFTTNTSSLQVLDLSNNLIRGDVSNLTLMIQRLGNKLQELYLDGNNISGTLFLDEVLQSTGIGQKGSSFKTLSLTNNNIAAVRYNKNDTLTILQYIRIGGNPFCSNTADVCSADAYAARCFCSNQSCLDLPVCNQAVTSKTFILEIALSTSVPFALLLLVAAVLLYRSRRQQQYLLLEVQRICEEYDVKPTIFTYNELRAATKDFHPDMKLGQGGYGAVYKGVLPNGNVVAVKQLHIKSHQGMDEFLNEVTLISGIKHRNLVKLKGCCIRGKQRLLVYEYVDNHDLDWNLLEGKSPRVLSWPERLKICLGVAHGLHYLHALAQPKIIHRDIKAANILLDSNLEPKIADFGLALLFPEETSHIMTVHVAGTKGYLAPEYATLGQLSEKADVYSFGVVCLEIVSGRRNIDNEMGPEEVVLTNWTQKLYKEGNVLKILDSRLESFTEDELLEVQKVIYTSLLCLQYSEDVRPPMARVISMLGHNDLNFMVTQLESIQVPKNHFDGSSYSTFEILHPNSMETLSEDDSVCLNEASSNFTF